MRWFALAMLGGLAGCDALFRLNEVKPPDGDGGTGAGEGGNGQPVCVGKSGEGGAGMYRTCLDAETRSLLELAGVIQTDGTDGQCTVTKDAVVGTVCVAKAFTVHVTGRLEVRGTTPLVVAAQTLVIEGLIYTVGQARGTCAPLLAPVPTAGGAGGTNATMGGNGGPATGTSTPVVGDHTVPFGSIIGGCDGGVGGPAMTGAGSAIGGGGGGAVYLAAESIEMKSGGVNASGDGGAPGLSALSTATSGGGGGGAGGLVVFDTVALAYTSGIAIANGGGGGGGGYTNSTLVTDGGFTSMSPATGGLGGPPGGGIGANANTPGGNADPNSTTSHAGGGGGGGAGRIVLYSKIASPLPTAAVSPPITINP